MLQFPVVMCVKSCKLIMGPVKPYPLGAHRRSLAQTGERGGRRGVVASIPLVDLSEPQAAVFNLSRCASFRNAMLR